MSTDDDAWAVSFAAFVVVIVAILLATLRWADKIDGAGAGVTFEQGADEAEGGR
jgi:hypothetical protein